MSTKGQKTCHDLHATKQQMKAAFRLLLAVLALPPRSSHKNDMYDTVIIPSAPKRSTQSPPLSLKNEVWYRVRPPINRTSVFGVAFFSFFRRTEQYLPLTIITLSKMSAGTVSQLGRRSGSPGEHLSLAYHTKNKIQHRTNHQPQKPKRPSSSTSTTTTVTTNTDTIQYTCPHSDAKTRRGRRCKQTPSGTPAAQPSFATRHTPKQKQNKHNTPRHIERRVPLQDVVKPNMSPSRAARSQRRRASRGINPKQE